MSATFLLSLFRRDGPAAIAKAIRYGFSPRAWRWLLTNMHYRRIVKKSGLLDEAWYRREYPEVPEKGLDPVQDFLTPPHDLVRLPNPDFVPGEYLAMNLDVMASRMPPAVHYATNGMREARPVSTLENFEKPFPPGTLELRREFPAAPARNRRTAIFASFSGDGRVKDTVLYYLRGLKEVVDNIVFVANCPVFPDEVAKLGGLVRLAVFRHHGCYDFGSYKIGWNEAKALGLIEPDVCDELVVCNDSCYGPVFPFSTVFDEMARRRQSAATTFDFWGLSLVRAYGGRLMIPSYFYVFGPAVLEGSELDQWFQRQEPCRNRGQVILRCESMLTQYLVDCGYVPDGLVQESFQTERRATSIKFPLSTMRDYGDPLVKIKALKGDSLEDLDEVDAFLAGKNPELAALLPRFPRDRRRSGMDIARAARENHLENLRETEALLHRAAESGRPVDVLLLSRTGDEDWLRPVCDALGDSPVFSVAAATVPCIETPEKSVQLAGLRSARAKIAGLIPDVRAVAVRTDSDGVWCDILPSPGVVFYHSASDSSDFHYNPRYAVGRNVLPVLVFDRNQAGPYPLEKEFARQNYAYFWKIFFSDREAFGLYAKHSIRKGENAVLVRDAAEAAAKLDEWTGESVR
ncbi:MAG: hypothetical protein IJ783_09560 [Kiritimatiellae bacterium]|nr:hypothetical protein [Kiritimatiellia bacterium]